MNTSQFMDKQIMGLSGSQGSGGGGELFDLMNPQEENRIDGGGVLKKEEIVPSYDFQPIRTVGSSAPIGSGGGGSSTGLDVPRPSWNSLDSNTATSNLKYAGILDAHEVPKVNHDKDKAAYDMATVAEVDRTMKKHADNLLHALEGVSARLSQLETRSRHLESSVDDLKVTIGNSNGSTDGRLRQLENILREVQTGMQVLRDKQEIAETQLQLAKLQASKGDHQLNEAPRTGQLDSQQQPMPPPPQQPNQQSFQAPVAPPLQPQLPAPNAPPPPPPHQIPPPAQYPPQLSQSHVSPPPSVPRETYYPPSQPMEGATQQYQMPPQQPQAQHYQSLPQLPQYSQPPQPPQPPQPVNPAPQLQPPMPHHPEESASYMPPPQTYPPSIRQPPPPAQPPSSHPPQQYYGPSSGMYEPQTSRPGSGQLSFPSGYGPPMGSSFSDPYPYSGSPSHYNSSMKQSPFSSSAPPSGGSTYPNLPKAQLLPQSQPAGSSSSGPAGNRVPMDDVIDKVSTMGFSREQVRATVKKLTENGQSVDLNVVLDKLMNGGEIQPQKGWFGR